MKTLSGCLAAACVATASAGNIPIDTKQVVTGLTFPVFVTHAPGDTSRLFVLEKQGRIRIVDISGATPTLLTTPFLDIDSLIVGGTSSSSEQGLLGLAFHPDYATNGYFFVYYTANSGADTVARYSVNPANPNLALTTGALTLMSIADPYTNHNGGWMGFSPVDGYLYISIGDGGSANDPGNRSQTIVNMKLGKMLRIIPNVAGTSPAYTNPTTNPFYGTVTGDDEIWAYGLRNPWRCSFDRQNGDLYIGDVGQDAVEEVDYQPAGVGGRNYGWRCTEGTSCTGLTGCTCNGTGLTPPVRTYTHSTAGGYSVIGGYCYRGCAMPEMQGIYFYADYVYANSWSFRIVGGAVTEWQSRNAELATAAGGQAVNTVSAFGEDANGEIYMVKQGTGGTTGAIFKIIPASGEVVCVPPNPYDLNDDGVIDGADLGMLLANWGGPGQSDFDGNGATDGADLGALLANFGT